MFLRKEVLVEGHDDTASHVGVKCPNPYPKRALIGIFKQNLPNVVCHRVFVGGLEFLWQLKSAVTINLKTTQHLRKAVRAISAKLAMWL